MAVNRTDLARGIDRKKMAPISYHTANVLRCVLQRLRMERKKLTLHRWAISQGEHQEKSEPADKGVSSLHLIIAIL